jgi:hypothetical protein
VRSSSAAGRLVGIGSAGAAAVAASALARASGSAAAIRCATALEIARSHARSLRRVDDVSELSRALRLAHARP